MQVTKKHLKIINDKYNHLVNLVAEAIENNNLKTLKVYLLNLDLLLTDKDSNFQVDWEGLKERQEASDL